MKIRQQHIETQLKDLLFFLLFCFGFALLGMLLLTFLTNVLGMQNPSNLAKNLTETSTISDRNKVRLFLFISHAFTFAIPCIAFAIWRYRPQTLTTLHLNRIPHPTNILYSTIIILAAFPFVMLTMWLNQQIPLSESMLELEATAKVMTENLLIMNNGWELAITLIVVAITPAVGEELMFRGILQPIFQKAFQNKHIAVWVAAILFSAIHFQMQGFIPRMLLGAFLGYFYLWTNNLWVSIFAHFVFNGSQVFGKYANTIAIENPEINLHEIALPSLISLAFLIILGRLFFKFNKSINQHINE